MPLNVESFSGDPAAWDAAVRGFEGWTHFHLYGWRHVIEAVFGHACDYLCCRDADGAIAGVLPLVQVRSRLFGHFLVSMPFLNYGGPLGAPPAVAALVARACEMARERGADLLELRSARALDVDLPVSHRKITVLLDLPPGDAEALWKQLPTKMRTKIRGTEKKGVSVVHGRDQLSHFYPIFARHMRDLGTPTLPRRFFEAIADAFGDDAWLACAWHEGQAIAGGCGFRWADRFEITWAAAAMSRRDLRPNYGLYWSLMERAAREGLALFDFGRSTPGGGTHEFKRQWGSRDAPLWWYQLAAGATRSTPSPDDPSYAWGPRLWKHLPVPLANFLGPRIVRNIP
jgi:FemAB-related protein (PEP-CTERM system-associated)